MNELLRNGSGYVDLTAYKAMKNYEGENQMTGNHGDIVEIALKTSGDIKTAIVVSADWKANEQFVNVIVITDEPKGSVCVPITTKTGIMYADCGMVSFTATNRIQSFIQSAKESEMKQVERGIQKCLGFAESVNDPVEKVVEKIVEVPAQDNSEELVKAQAEAAVYKDLYEKLLEKMLKG